jgi:hypothetical protein
METQPWQFRGVAQGMPGGVPLASGLGRIKLVVLTCTPQVMSGIGVPEQIRASDHTLHCIECGVVQGNDPLARLVLAGADVNDALYQRDDLNDAFAALWTAVRVIDGTARVLDSELRDQHGLAMKMWV